MTIFDSPTLGDVLQDYRKKKHLTRQVLSERLGVSINTLKNWEDGSSEPSVKSMIRIADEMKVPLAYIYKLKRYTI